MQLRVLLTTSVFLISSAVFAGPHSSSSGREVIDHPITQAVIDTIADSLTTSDKSKAKNMPPDHAPAWGRRGKHPKASINKNRYKTNRYLHHKAKGKAKFR